MVLKTLVQIYSRYRHKIPHWLLPSACVLCGQTLYHEQPMCAACQKALPILPHSCPQCGLFLSSESLAPCGACQKNPPPFDRTFSLFPYEFPVMDLITQLKFHHQLIHTRTFGYFFMQAIKTKWYAKEPLPDLIIPVPLHPAKLSERGFNQTLELAKPLAKALSIPIDATGVKRIRKTQAQSGLSAFKRKDNMEGAFFSQQRYENLHLAVIDDVITTGHTVNALCQTLKKQGAREIHVWCCARRG